MTRHLALRIATAVLATTMALTACGTPVPPDKSAYVGEWRAKTMALLITQDGRVAYKRLDAGVTRSVKGPIRRFDGDNFEVGIGPMATTFVVSVTPHQAGGKWKMTVDGVELTRVE